MSDGPEASTEDIPAPLRRFFECPLCGGVWESGYDGLWFRWELGEVWLMDGTARIHRHVAGLPVPGRLVEGFTW